MKLIIEDIDSDEIEVTIRGNTDNEDMKKLIKLLKAKGGKKSKEILVGKKEDKEFLIPIKEIEYFSSEGGILLITYKNNQYKASGRLFEIEEKYSSLGFFRISKSIVLNLNHIKYLEVEFSGNYTVVTKKDEKMTISRRYVGNVRKYIKEMM